MQQIAGDIIILHMCTKLYDQIYGFWDVVHDGRTYRWTDRKSDTNRGECPI